MDHDGTVKKGKQSNVLPIWGNESTMNLNQLILTNIQSSTYFKVHLFKLKTYHEVIDEIYYQVKHLEPWERGSRKTSGQTGMCGGVRGVGAGGIVSTAFCLLYKLYTLRLTRKQVNGLLTHTDSPFIRALGFMYLRYTQPPGDLFDWYEPYLQDEEEIDPKAGGGQSINIGTMLKQFLMKLDWFGCLFPRIPVPIQKQIEKRLDDYHKEHGLNEAAAPARYPPAQQTQRRDDSDGYDERRTYGSNSARSYSRERDREYRSERSEERRHRVDESRGSRDHERKTSSKKSGRHDRSRERDRSSHRSESDRYGERDHERKHSSSSGHHHKKHHHRDRDRDHHDSRRYRD